ncbi:hypothetical protein Xen7305DRAFT_00026070 [Xenococcus sp. PCC 7305]|uniref:choice-of-anchor I domain-containing protein n=1 Tax=Xenococcus sp. PCC 7305 TaxID=102125 RepID=UPI0002AC203D|nr:esterase-like activity of phytase family protein [Xenococcus sp. PCC 7305]ELS02889.1 hypothetical protein Xen7305DRAFT_00026070 [Xenococcus sp. PCC 7305]
MVLDTLNVIGRYQVEIPDGEEGGAEISAYDPDSQSLFVVNAFTNAIDILSLADPTNPSLVSSIELDTIDAGINSVAVSNGIVAAAVASDPTQDPGVVAFFDTSGTLLGQVTVGALPDMVTFTPDGTKVLVANEGEPGDDVDPVGSISIIELAEGVANATVTTAGFEAFDGLSEQLRSRGVRIFPDKTFAEDAEPEFITVSADGSTAYIVLQENNAVAVLDIAAGTITEIQPLGTKNYSPGTPQLTQYPWDLSGEVLGTTPAGQEILLGGLSGLFYEGTNENGQLQFIATPDRGPNGEPTDVDGDGLNERPFPLPDYQARLVRFTLDRETGEIAITQQINLFRQDGVTPITGLPNLQAGDPGSAYTDEEPVDLNGNPLDNDPFGADMESIVVAPDGTFWMSDEYRPAIYHFSADGVLIDRFIPIGTAAAGTDAGTFGTETIPEVYAQRRANRGFEGMALNTDNGLLYAFIQSPIDNPDITNTEASEQGLRSDENSRNSQVLRILELDPATGQPTGEYVYFLEGSAGVDKIGDAVYVGNGKFQVIERDSGTDTDSKKFIFEVDLTGATNILGTELSNATDADNALEGQTADELLALGVNAVSKTKILNLPSIGYLAGDKPEGLALLDDGSLAVINDNDFGLLDEPIPVDGSVPFNPDPTQTVLGIIEFDPLVLDASDEDGSINLQNYPIFGLFQPDAVASYEVDGATFYVTANEGDARDEDVRVADIILDPTVFPNAAELQDDAVLGRLEISAIDGDLDGDGDYDQLFAYGGRSFTIWDSRGNLVFDSGDELETITAQLFPNLFNSQGTIDSFDSRSNAKGIEPEGLVIGKIDDIPYAFVGLERIGGVIIYDISDPTDAEFVDYVNPTNENGDAIDIAPEGLTFISADDSPNGEPLLVIANEVSNTTTIYQAVLSDFDTDIFRFRSEVAGQSSYLYAGGDEAESIRANFADTFTEEGFAFTVSAEPQDDLIDLYRFRSEQGTYLYVGEDERNSINNNPNLAAVFTEEGRAFSVYGAGSGEATEFSRFRNLNNPNNYLYAAGAEAESIRNDFATTFVDEGAAFESEI